MAVFRIEKTHDYTVMSNHHLRNAGLSLKSKGSLSMMLSLPEDWSYTSQNLTGQTRMCRIWLAQIRKPRIWMTHIWKEVMQVQEETSLCAVSLCLIFLK